MSRIASKIIPYVMLLSLFINVGGVSAQANNAPASPKVSKFLPGCILKSPTGEHLKDGSEGPCRSISIFVILLLNIANYLFTIVGAFALLFFVYGGFTLILSRGNSEQVSKGTGILTAAIVGLIIVFSAYMLVRFLGTAVGLKSEYRIDPQGNSN